jgi:transcriptional regulator with XRE-family HTH domain
MYDVPDANYWSTVVGRNIKRLRNDLGMSQATLSCRLVELGYAIHQTRISNIEKGQNARGNITRIPIDHVMVFALALEVSVDELTRVHVAREGQEAA